MKKAIFVMINLMALAVLAGCAPQIIAPTPSATPVPAQPQPVQAQPTTPPVVAFDPARATLDVIVEGTPVTLVNGYSEVEGAVGAGKTITQVFGNVAAGDLNADGLEDAVFVLTQSTGGSGTFYYVAATLQTAAGYAGTNAVYLGDRIAVQSTSIAAGSITVNYADRKPEEPFAAAPTVKQTRVFKIEGGKLVEMNAQTQLVGREWTWVSTQMNDGSSITPRQPEAFRITFGADGSVSGTTDCNNFFGQYQLEGSHLTFGPLGMTRMFCPDSQETEFVQALGEVDQFLLDEATGQLVLLIKFDSGSMIFE
ncbi:MAG TPA: META domain-containing protein [Anaerolineaceae bacterium]